MAISFLDDVLQESGVRLGRLCGRPASISAVCATKTSSCAHLFGRKACRPEVEYLAVRLLASLAKRFAT